VEVNQINQSPVNKDRARLVAGYRRFKLHQQAAGPFIKDVFMSTRTSVSVHVEMFFLDDPSLDPPPPVRSQHYLKLPVQFKPTTAGRHAGSLLVQSETSGSLVIQLTAEATP